MKNTYHVSKNGNDYNEGSIKNSFFTIQKAADIAQPGDTIVIHEGTYRECVNPKNGGSSEINRITYTVADGEKVIIKGSEVITNWEMESKGIYKTEIPNSFFGDFNPYKEIIFGDWLLYPTPNIHRGQVYINGQSFYEVFIEKELTQPEKDKVYHIPTIEGEKHIYRKKEDLHPWMCSVSKTTTTIRVNFGDLDPAKQLVEINVRESCFYPTQTGKNYITVQGFEMAQAATPWAPPTADQIGLIGPHWSKGWIIENNIIHDAKCSAISLGKESSTGDNDCTKYQIKPGYQCQMEAVFKSFQNGWSKDTIGSHIVRNNTIYDCGQNGIVGHLGCVFSEIYGNNIFRIGTKHEFFGWEIAAIKFHAPIDVRIHDNCVHESTLGIWLDWQAQGTRVSRNVFFNNDGDASIEVCNGPFIFDNNIFGSQGGITLMSQGAALINNLFCGTIEIRKILDRSTPYHVPHSTAVMGCSLIYGGDHRILNNIMVGNGDVKNKNVSYGTAVFDNSPASNEEFHQKIIDEGIEDIEKFVRVEQPVMIDGNVYCHNAKKYKKETNFFDDEQFDPNVKVIQKEDGVYLSIRVKKEMLHVKTSIVTTESLGTVRIVNAVYDNPDASSIKFDVDLLHQKRSESPVAGPIENLREGENFIKVFTSNN